MSTKRLVWVSFVIALISIATAVVFLNAIEELPRFNRVLLLLVHLSIVFGLVLLVIYVNFTRRMRRIKRKIIESGAMDFSHEGRSMTLEHLELAVEEWTSKQNDLIKELESREVFRREYIGNVSHELKTPIFNIQGYILTLLDGAKDDPKIATKFLKRAAKSVDRMTSLIKDMDALAKVESGQYDIRKSPTRTSLLLEDTLQGIESYVEKHNAHISVMNQTNGNSRVLCDPAKIEQVLDNLLVNAIKYGGTKKNVRLIVRERGTKVEFAVEDDGIGIPERDLGRIFERFYRVDKARSRDVGGSGLGLSIVKHIIDKHDETITVSSQDGKGTTFRFTLAKA